MIDTYCFTPDWLKEKRKTYKTADPSIMERVVYALCLLQQLKHTGLPFVFKGGTSLLLLLPEPARFSIDVDIIVSKEMKKAELETFLNKIKEQKVFTDIVLDAKRSYNDKIPKAHYKFEFNSQLTGKPSEILLDVLFEKTTYPNCIERPITSEWIRLTREAVSVTTPDVNSITGDKLTAFAPGTIGVPYKMDKEREIIKQLFDVGMLYHQITDFETFKTSYTNIANQEIAYRESTSMTIHHALDDTVNAALILAREEKIKLMPRTRRNLKN
jgi:hypothetical protein